MHKYRKKKMYIHEKTCMENSYTCTSVQGHEYCVDPVEFVVYRVLGNTIEQTRVSEFCNKNCSGPERREQLQLTYIRQNQICINDLRMYRFEGKTLAMESMNSEYFELLLSLVYPITYRRIPYICVRWTPFCCPISPRFVRYTPRRGWSVSLLILPSYWAESVYAYA
mgnify:CR=1 FL=1